MRFERVFMEEEKPVEDEVLGCFRRLEDIFSVKFFLIFSYRHLVPVIGDGQMSLDNPVVRLSGGWFRFKEKSQDPHAQ